MEDVGPAGGARREPMGAGLRLARVLTEVLSPVNQVPVLIAAVALESTETPLEAVRWGLFTIIFFSAAPLAIILIQLRRGRISDYHIREREQRKAVGWAMIASTISGLVLLHLLGAPRGLVALAGSMAAGITTAGLITLIWKISMHVAVTAGSVTVLTLVFGYQPLLLSPLIPLSAWSRVALRDHTPAQALAGAALGVACSGVVFQTLQ